MSARLAILAAAPGACIALASTHAKAADGPRADDFAALDTNHDGRLDHDEFIKAGAIYDRIRLGHYLDDTIITAKVKAALVKEEKLKGFDISVQTQAGQVLLSGFVGNPQLRTRAVKNAMGVDGVRDVHDGIVVQ